MEKYEDPVINTTTGASYDGTFELLVEAINSGELKIDHAIWFNLTNTSLPGGQVHRLHLYAQEVL